MSNWYVRRSRERFWAKGMEQDKINAYMTLYTALVTISKAAAPMIPFMTEEIYQNLVRSIDTDAPESIHLCDFPVVERGIDRQEAGSRIWMMYLKIVVMGRACRNSCQYQEPSADRTECMSKSPMLHLSEFYQEIIEDELNVKKVEFTDDVRDLYLLYLQTTAAYRRTEVWQTCWAASRKHLAALDGNAAMDELNADGCSEVRCRR